MARSENKKQELSKKYFVIEEVEELLPKVEKAMAEAVKLNKVLDLLSSIEIEVYDENQDDLKKVTKLNKQFHMLSFKFYRNMEILEDMGCIVKDLDIGLVDFYSRFEGKEILLCWKLGEKGIKYWHDVEAGYAGRRPIMDLRKEK